MQLNLSCLGEGLLKINFFFKKLILFLCILDCFDEFLLKIKKKYYFDIFSSEKHFKNYCNHNPCIGLKPSSKHECICSNGLANFQKLYSNSFNLPIMYDTATSCSFIARNP
jgi:hypothetical protein